MTEQQEDVAVKERELRLAETVSNYWNDRVEQMRGMLESIVPAVYMQALLEQERAKAAVDVAEIRYNAAKSRLRIEK